MKTIIKLLCFSAVLLWGASCTPPVTDRTEFALYYYDIGNMYPGDEVSITPSYIGETPSDFRIYSVTRDGKIFYDPKIDGELTEEDSFYIDRQTGTFMVQNTTDMDPGKYVVSLSCTSGGKAYDYPGMITVEILSL